MMSDDPQKISSSIGQLKTIVERDRSDGKTVVHCHGVFDLLHIGHIRYLQAARRLGDVLIVTVTPDRYVNKGTHRPAFHEKLRVDSIAALACVDHVALNEWPTAVEVIQSLKPSIYVKGAEFRETKTPELIREEEAVAAAGGVVEFIDDFTSSSSSLINTYLTPFSREVESYLARFRTRFSADDVMRPLHAARNLKVLVVGEAIIDEYVNCAAIGKSMKSPNIAVRFQSRQQFAGGALAVANHIAGFADHVSLFAMLGEAESQEEWIRTQLRDNIACEFHHKKNSPTIRKRRYHETYYENTLFAEHVFDDRPMCDEEQAEIAAKLAAKCGEYDLVIVADYGHGFLGDAAVQALCDSAKFLAVSTQADPANLGLHTISRYPRADFLSLSQNDVELECRQRTGDMAELTQRVCETLSAAMGTTTLGKAGCLCYHRGSPIHEAAGLSTRIVDRIGAGEAFLAVTALCAAVKMSQELLAFCGNVAGAEAVAVVGHAMSFAEQSFERHVNSLLK